MLTKEENELLTRVGPGTPGGELMRHYWHPVAATAQLDENPVRKVRILCEDLVLYRDRQGRLWLISERYPHRAVHLQRIGNAVRPGSAGQRGLEMAMPS